MQGKVDHQALFLVNGTNDVHDAPDGAGIHLIDADVSAKEVTEVWQEHHDHET